MKITLTASELKHAIACYLKANAAVDVGEMTFSLKKCGIETVVETTVIDSESNEVVPEPTVTHIPEASTTFEAVKVPETFSPNYEELVDELQPKAQKEFVEMEEDTPEDPVEQGEEDSLSSLDEAIAAIEEASFDLNFDTVVKTETVEEMPVQNAVSIADILGMPG